VNDHEIFLAAKNRNLRFASVNRDVIRIFSDLHYGDRASTLRALPDLAPLFEGATEIILNGDTLDTRPSSDPGGTAVSRTEVVDFFVNRAPPTTWLTGNHDPDISLQHAVEIADRRVFVTHGDILFENLVPWGQDAAVLGQRVALELAGLPPEEREQLDAQFQAIRRAAASIPQRHQSERSLLKYALGFVADTLWPPMRILRVLEAWKETPGRAAALLRKHSLPAQVFVMGHTHRLGLTRSRSGIVVINTGSLCPPSGGGVVDILSDRILLRSVERRGKEFRLGPTITEFALARTRDAETLKV